ncbi:MAG: D-inositol-3-phosphate glycosyltransferase [Acidimicrobiales bacterium]|nr:MAG: glycosyltransferase family 1 protein [Actinomycetota bacterium]MBV6507788.1 D-inositol-3-phosphate glycosyltransferase [Acidimicrobiales bacterium]RIK05945.1 MAG: hypothetical protein DCC48_08275 [Acidobacteriota bacterium]
MELLNTEQVAGTGGRLNWRNVVRALRDTARTFLRARQAAIVHPQTALWPGFVALRTAAICAAARLAGAAVVTHVHSGRLIAHDEQASWLFRFSCRLVARLSHRVITVADAAAVILRNRMPGASVETMDNAVEVDAISISALDNDPPVVVYVGGLTPRKGLLDLFAALGELRRTGSGQWMLEIIGGVSEAGQLEADIVERAAVEAGLADSLMGPLDAEEVRRHLSQADVFVLPSHMDAQPLAILEAMAAGLPIVATAVGQIPVMVREGQEGLIVAPHDPPALADALDRLLADPDLRKRMGTAARERAARHYDRHLLSRRLSDVYESLLGRR